MSMDRFGIELAAGRGMRIALAFSGYDLCSLTKLLELVQLKCTQWMGPWAERFGGFGLNVGLF